MTIAALMLAAAVPAGAQVPVGGVTGPGVGQALNGANAQIRDLDESARQASRNAANRLAPPKGKAEAGVAVTRGSRCHAQEDAARRDAYEPVYRDGAYRCEPTGRGFAAGARVTPAGD